MAGSHPLTPRSPRTRRTKNYWEPIYEPKAVDKVPFGDWRLAASHGQTRATLTAEDLAFASEQGWYPKSKDVHFSKCDFFGYFDKIDKVIVFENCTFSYCDFGFSTWRRAKFTNCQFEKTSFTQCEFIECEFRACEWREIGLSGNETRFDKTLIDNPEIFVKSAFLYLDDKILKANGTTRDKQLVRLWETKSVIARQLYNDLKITGDEDSFYKACKAFIQCTTRYKFERAWRPGKRKDGVNRNRFTGALLSSILEMAFFRLVASINRWGESVVRPLVLMASCFLIYGIIYYITKSCDFWPSFEKSFEITSVAGYTRGAADSPSASLRVSEWSNLVISITLYTVFFSTVVSKICRVR